MFKSTHPSYALFAAVGEWVVKDKGKFIVGGTQYKTELHGVRSVLALLGELERRGKVLRKRDSDVDSEEVIVKAIQPCKNFDDPHLVALVRLTGCQLVCVEDPRAHKYLKASKFYSAGVKPPKLYTKAPHKKLLCGKHIAHCCK